MIGRALPRRSAKPAVAWLRVVAPWWLAACAPGAADPPAQQAKTETVAHASEPVPAPEVSGDHEGLSWIEDDWARASARAKQRGVPIIADMWAPWCHTCMSMRSTVLLDKSLEPLAERFVWLAVDTDKPQNAELMGKLEMSMWPTFFVLEPDDASVHAEFSGAATVGQFRSFLEDGEATYLDAHGTSLAEDDPRRWHRDGIRLAQAKHWDAADQAFARALELAPDSWNRRADVLVARIRGRLKAKDFAACATLAREQLATVERWRAASVTDFSLYANLCLKELEPAVAEPVRAQLIAALHELSEDQDAPLSVDDRSDLLMNLRELQIAAGDETAARASAERQRDLLAKAFHDARSPTEAMTYNWPRCEVAVYLGEGEALLPDLQKNVADLPHEYDPPYRLAWLLHELGRDAEAKPHVEAALEKSYGPRRERIEALAAKIDDP